MIGLRGVGESWLLRGMKIDFGLELFIMNWRWVVQQVVFF